MGDNGSDIWIGEVTLSSGRDFSIAKQGFVGFDRALVEEEISRR